MEGRTVGNRRKPAYGAGGRARLGRLAQGRALRALLRLLQHSGHHLRRRAGFPSGYGIRNMAASSSTARSCLFAFTEATVAESHRHHPQGLWRRLRRDELEAYPGRCELCLALGRDRGDGSRRVRRRSSTAAELGDPEAIKGAHRSEYRRARFANPFVAAERGYIDEVILPRNTRRRICRALNMLRNKQVENP